GHLSTRRLTPDEFEAGSDWWVSSRAYFDGHTSEAARIPVMNESMKKEVARGKMYTQMHKFMVDMQVGPMRQAKKGPIIVDQHYGLRFPQGGPSSFPTQRSTSFFEGVQATPSMVIIWLRQTGKPLCHRILVRLEDYIECAKFQLHPYAVYLNCHMMGYLVPENFWRELVLRLYMAGFHSLEQSNTHGWLSVDQMNAWIELLIRDTY
nr:hypothetical protein [Tanacetum cinerariifolium]